jgi:hypothetical protein
MSDLDRLRQRSAELRRERQAARHYRYNHGPKGRARNQRYEATPAGRARIEAYRETAKGVFARFQSEINASIRRHGTRLDELWAMLADMGVKVSSKHPAPGASTDELLASIDEMRAAVSDVGMTSPPQNIAVHP